MRRQLIALVLGLALCLTGCARTAPDAAVSEEPEVSAAPSAAPVKKEFTLPYYPDASLHPITGDNRVNLSLTGLVYQGLFELDNTFTPSGVLCAGSSVSGDGLTWTFTLKKTLFSDGTALTAADAAASLNLARTSTLYAARLAQVRSVAAPEDDTVVITLSRPNGALPALLDIPIVREAKEGGIPLGTGPYAFAGGEDDLRLVRQNSAPATARSTIPLKPITGADELIYTFDAGEISLVSTDLTGANALGYAPGYEAFEFPTTNMLFVGFQTAGGPCKDPLVRQAISRAFDRDSVAASLLAGHAESAALPFSPRSSLYGAGHQEAGAYSPSAAAELLEQAGYTAGEDGLLYRGRSALELTFAVNTDNPLKVSVAEYLAGQLTALGMSVTLQKLPWDDYVAALERGNFDLFLGEAGLTADFDLAPFLEKKGALNYGGYGNQEMDTLLLQFQAADATQRPQAAANLLNLFQTEVPFAPLCFKSHTVLTRWGSVFNLAPTRQNPFYDLENLRFGA